MSQYIFSVQFQSDLSWISVGPCPPQKHSETLGSYKDTAGSLLRFIARPFTEHNIPLPDSQVVATDLVWARWIQSTPNHPVLLRFILILPSIAHLAFQVVSSFQFFVPKFWVHFSSLPRICDESELEATAADLPLTSPTVYFYIPWRWVLLMLTGAGL
jgi:hypothetical protein